MCEIMTYLLSQSLTATPCKYYMTSNITETVYNILLSSLFHRFSSLVKVSAFEIFS